MRSTLIGLAAFALFAGSGGCGPTLVDGPAWVPAPAPAPSFPRVEVPAEVPPQRQDPPPPPPPPMDGTIAVSVQRGGFVPVEFAVRATEDPSLATVLSPVRPASVVSEPAYQSASQLYGCMDLGTRDDRRYCFAFDVIAGPHPLLYFDGNQNGDLTDDGGPVLNQGTGPFAAGLRIPFSSLVKDVDLPGDFSLWFFTNVSLWSAAPPRVAHYSRTQLKGSVTLRDGVYPAYLVDAGANDADLTNDGLCVDLDRDGQIGSAEWFPANEPVRIHGETYVFTVSW